MNAEEEIGVFIEVESEKPTESTPSESTPMRKEHVPPEPKLFRPLEFQDDRHLPYHLDPPEPVFKRPQTPITENCKLPISEPTGSLITSVKKFGEHQPEVIQKLIDTKEIVQNAITLGQNETDDFVLKFETWSDPSQNLNDSKLVEKVEKEQAKRRFCEAKIIDLQKDIISLEETNYSLKESCARKNVILGKISQTLDKNREEIELYLRKNNLEVIKLRSHIQELRNNLENVVTESQNYCAKITEQSSRLSELDNIRIDLERRTIALNDTNENLRIDFEKVSNEKEHISEELKLLKIATDQKLFNNKKIIENEREKVARMEKDENSAILKLKSVQQSCDMLRVQLEQGKVMRENLQKQVALEKNNLNKQAAKIAEIRENHQAELNMKDDEISQLARDKKHSDSDLMGAQKELDALKSEFELEKSRFQTEMQKQELYFKSMIKSQMDELNQKFSQQIRNTSENHQSEKRDLSKKLSRLKMDNEQQLTDLETRLEEEYQKKMKIFLQQHFNQGLTALSTATKPSQGITQFEPLRSSSPRENKTSMLPTEGVGYSETQAIIPRPPVAPRSQPSTKCSPKQKREQQLKKMIATMLNQTPLTELDFSSRTEPTQMQKSLDESDKLTSSETDYLKQKLRDLIHDQSLTDKEKKNIQRIAQLMK